MDANLEELQTLQQETTEAHSQYLATLQERDSHIRDLIRAGISMYSIAKALDLSESAVRVIRDR